MAQDRVFDASALVAWMRDEPGAEMVERLIAEAKSGSAALLVTAINLGEVWHTAGRVRKDADTIVNQFFRVGFTVVDVNWQLAREAAMLKLKYKLSYTDCCAAALAKLQRVELVTCDYEFKLLEREVKIRWLKSRPQ